MKLLRPEPSSHAQDRRSIDRVAELRRDLPSRGVGPFTRATAFATSLAFLLVAAIIIALLAGLGSPGAVQAQSSPCTAVLTRSVSPRTVILGDEVTVTLGFQAACPESLTSPLHLAFALDASGSMAGQPLTDTLAAIRTWIDALDLSKPTARVGFVAFNDAVMRRCALMSSRVAVDACLAPPLATQGGSDLALGMTSALELLVAGRPLAQPGTPNEAIVLLSDGGNNQGCDPALAAARQAKAQGVLVITICVGESCDLQCLREMASSSRYTFTLGQASALLPELLPALRDNDGSVIRRLTLIDRLPPNLAYAPDSAAPAAVWDPAATSLTWTLQGPSAVAATASYRLRPLEVGSFPSGAGASAEWRDSQGQIGTVVAAIDTLTVLPPPTASPGPPPSPTPLPSSTQVPAPSATAPPPTPPAGPTSEPSASPAAGTATAQAPSPSATSLPRPTADRPTVAPTVLFPPLRIFLPLVLREPTLTQAVDLVLVVDSSLSMGERLGPEGSKLEAARAAVDRLLEGLAPERHRLALVATDATARQLTPFSRDAASLRQALERLTLGNGTALDKGIALATELLLGEARRGLTRGVIVLISDGRAHEARPDDAVAAAQHARDLKLEVYAVGLGREVDQRTLGAIADSPARYLSAPDRAAALRAFERLAGWMDQPAEELWGQR